jgi:hypothetical protein
MAVFADANVNGNMYTDAHRLGYGIIDCPAECDGFGSPLGPILYNIMQAYRRVITTQDSSGVHFQLIRYHNPPYPLNDMAVTVESQQYPGFQNFGTIPFLKNHTTIGNTDVGAWVANRNCLSMQQ